MIRAREAIAELRMAVMNNVRLRLLGPRTHARGRLAGRREPGRNPGRRAGAGGVGNGISSCAIVLCNAVFQVAMSDVNAVNHLFYIHASERLRAVVRWMD